MALFKNKNILGVKVADVTLETIDRILENLIKSPGKKTVFGANPHAINFYQKNKEFKRALDHASLIYPEGTGTFLASKILGKPLSGRTNLLDFIFNLLRTAEIKRWPLYVLGGSDKVSKNAIKNLKKEFPKLKVDGNHGYFIRDDVNLVISEINRQKPKILFVAMGTPKQEIWIHEHMDKIDAKAFFGIGGSVDIIAGRLPRAPLWIRKVGLEWFYRTYKEPRRLWYRYLVGNIIFLFRVFLSL